MIALRYLLAVACVGVAVLLQISAVDRLFHPMALCILAVLTTAWFGGLGPGVFAALLSAFALPHLIAENFPLLGGVFDLPRFAALALTAAVIGVGVGAHRRTEAALREREHELSKARDELEAAVAARTAELAASEARYARAMEATEAGHWEWDLVANEVFHSARFRELYGVPVEQKFATRDDWKARQPLSPLERERQERALHEAIADPAKSYDMELSFEIRPGVVRWLRSRGKVFRDEEGRPLRVTGATTDITAQKLAQEALRESEQRYERAMAASEAGYWDWHVVENKFFVSPKALELGGFPPGTTFDGRGEFMARAPMHPEDRARWERAVQALFNGNGERLSMEVRYLIRGETRWYSFNAICLRDGDGKVVRWTGSSTDVTARRRAEEALRLSEERHALALAASKEGHFDNDLQAGEIFVSARTNEIYGFPSQAEVAKRAEFVAKIPFHPDDRDRVIHELSRPDGQAPNDLYEIECRIVPRPGETRWIQSRAKVVRDAAGRPRRRVGVLMDITERKLAEEALRLSEERYALAMEVTEDGHFDWNVRTDEIFASAQALRVIGVPQDLHYRTRGDLMARVRYHPDDAPRIRAQWRAALSASGADHEFEYRILRGELEEPRWIRGRWKVFRDAAGAAQRVIGVVTDVTERRLAVDSVRASELRFRTLAELNSGGYWEQDEDLRYTPSQFPQDITGYPTGERVGKTRWEVGGNPTPLSGSWRDHQADLAAHRPFRDFEYRRLRPDGEIGYYSASGAPIFDDQGRFDGYYGVASDITERKRFEDELRSRTEMLEVAQKAARAVPWEWRNGAEPAVNRWSPELCAMFGLPPGGFDGTARGWWRLCHPEDRKRVRLAIAQAHASGEIDVEYRVVHPDGKARWLHQRGREFLDANGKPVRSIGFMFDVTERHKVEDDLRSRQEMLELAQKAARAIAFEWKIGEGEGENRWSPDLEALYGFVPGSYDGTFEAWKKVVHPDDWPAVKMTIRLAEQTGEVACEYRVVHPDDSVHWLQARGRMFSGADGKPARVVGFMQDVTGRKRSEEELRKLELKLRRAQRLEAMGTLAGGIAHDFNNILGAILGYGEMAMRSAKRGTRLHRDVDAILAAGERGRALVDRILAFSRSGVGERTPVHVEGVVREALDQLAPKLPPNIAILPRLHAGRAAMLGDSTQVHQVVMNLATNALHAMPQGGLLRVSLGVARLAAPRAAAIGSVSAGDYLVLTVKDSGTGIPPEVLERMFDPFYTTKDVGVGSGLGLSLVHGIVASVGGAIDVATRVGKGSTFTVYLPRSGDAPAKAAHDRRPLPRGDGQRVLVVDDEEPLVRLAAETLERLGYAPVPFTSSLAALAAFRAAPQSFDAVLTDERMPGLSGSALIREMRAIREAVPVVLMSGHLGIHSGEANVVARKPLSARDLAASIARALQPGIVTAAMKPERPALR